MKKMMAVLLMALMTLSLAACGQKVPDDRKDPEGGDAPGQAGNMQIGNPWVDCATLGEAAKVAGFDIAIPGKFDGYENKVYQAIEKTMIQVFYYDGDPEAETSSRITVRKGTGSEDISGDYNEYSEIETAKIHGFDVQLKGEKGLVCCATWTWGGYSFSITADKGLTKETVSNAVEEMSTVAG